MRTTVDIPEEIYRKLKVQAAERGETVRAIILRGIEQELRPKARTGKRAEFPLIRSNRKDKINLTREQIDEAMFG